jgi:hypothetical protein
MKASIVNEERSACMHSSQSIQVQNTRHLRCSNKSCADNKICLLAFPYLKCYNYTYHNGIATFIYIVLLINIVLFKLSILNQHRFIISYQNRLSVIFAITSISQFYILEWQKKKIYERK